MQNKDSRVHLTGAIHIHSCYSDGTGDINKITKAAQKTGLSWIIISDHNNFDIKEGIINGITVIKGEEISPDNGNHCLALGINKFIPLTYDSQININSVRSNGGFAISAHPDESETRKNSNKPLRWLDKNIIPDGVEIWNWFSQWADNYDSSNIFKIAYAYLFRNRLVTKPNKETIQWWDKLNENSEKIIPAICGVDAHALKIKDYIIPVTIFPYEQMFKTILNEIIINEPLSETFEIRKNQILQAIKSGKNTIINKIVSKNIPEIYISNEKEIAYSGDFICLDKNTYLNYNSNKKSDIFVFKDGKEYFTDKTDNLKIKITETGKYRVEVEQNGRGFVYTNPIIVKERL